MLINIQKLEPQIKIYRDTKYDRIATWKPVIKKELKVFVLTVDNWFVSHKWERPIV